MENGEISQKIRISHLHEYYSPLKQRERKLDRNFSSEYFQPQEFVGRLLEKKNMQQMVDEVNKFLHLNKKYSIQNKELFYENYNKYISIRENLTEVADKFLHVKTDFRELMDRIDKLQKKSSIITENIGSKKKKIEELKNIQEKLQMRKIILTLPKMLEKAIQTKQFTKSIALISVGKRIGIFSRQEVQAHNTQIQNDLNEMMQKNGISFEEYLAHFTKLSQDVELERAVLQNKIFSFFMKDLELQESHIDRKAGILENVKGLNLGKIKSNLNHFLEFFAVAEKIERDDDADDIKRKTLTNNGFKIATAENLVRYFRLFFKVLLRTYKPYMRSVDMFLEHILDSLMMVSTEIRSFLFILSHSGLAKLIPLKRYHRDFLDEIFKMTLIEMSENVQKEIQKAFTKMSENASPDLSITKKTKQLNDKIVEAVKNFVIVYDAIVSNQTEDYIRKSEKLQYSRLKVFVENIIKFLFFQFNRFCLNSMSRNWHNEQAMFIASELKTCKNERGILVFYNLAIFFGITGLKKISMILSEVPSRSIVNFDEKNFRKLLIGYSKNILMYFVEFLAQKVTMKLKDFFVFPEIEKEKEGIVKKENESDGEKEEDNEIHERECTKEIIDEVQSIKELIGFFFLENKVENLLVDSTDNEKGNKSTGQFAGSSLSYGNDIDTLEFGLVTRKKKDFGIRIEKVNDKTVLGEIIKYFIASLKETIRQNTIVSEEQFRQIQVDVLSMKQRWGMIFTSSNKVMRMFNDVVLVSIERCVLPKDESRKIVEEIYTKTTMYNM